MADLDRIKRNVAKMASMNAPEADIDAYIGQEGVTTEQVRAHRSQAPQTPQTSPTSSFRDAQRQSATADRGALSASTLGGSQGLTFGWGDELMAGAFTPLEMAIGAFSGEDAGKGIGQRVSDAYGRGVDLQRTQLAAARENHPVATTVGTVTGGVATGAALARGGLSAATNAANAGGSLGRVAMGSARDGAALGALFGAGEGEGAGKASGALQGMVAGGLLGGVAPYAIAGTTAAVSPILAPVGARLRPQSYANAALSSALQRSGKSADDVANALTDATADGQQVFTVADALGNSGQRMLSTVTRTPNDARQAVTEQLLSRQAGQGRRVSNALIEGFDAPRTAAQQAATLTAARNSAADSAYDAARRNAGAVDVSGAIQTIDDFIPRGMKGQIAEDSVEGVMTRARAMLTKGDANLTEFSSVLRVKQDLDDMIDRAVRSGSGNQARNLMRVRGQVDDALTVASPSYASARDAFRTGSRAIDAIDIGAQAARRGRSADTRDAFKRLTDAERAGFRVGYANQMLDQTENAAIGVNKVRPLRTDASAEEFPAFAAPGRADQLGRRLDREDTMFQTQAAALGGSRTADNLADFEDMASFDPAMIPRLLSGDIMGAGMAAVTKALNETKGLPPRVLEQIGSALMETNPTAARQILSAANTKSLNAAGRKRVALTVLNSVTAPAAGRSLAP